MRTVSFGLSESIRVNFISESGEDEAKDKNLEGGQDQSTL